jgi:hypothetical protein
MYLNIFQCISKKVESLTFRQKEYYTWEIHGQQAYGAGSHLACGREVVTVRGCLATSSWSSGARFGRTNLIAMPMGAWEFGNMGNSPRSSTTVSSMVVWTMHRLGLELVMAF